MLLGYNTNGLAHHDPLDALDLLAELGYGSVALTLDHGRLDPFAPDLTARLAVVGERLQRLGLRNVIETGARFLLDPRVKHEPTLVSPDPERRSRRIDFLHRAIDIAALLGSDCVSLWSGVLRWMERGGAAFDRLVTGCARAGPRAARGIVLGFEPELGMFIDTQRRYDELVERLGRPAEFRLTLDIGHLHCQGRDSIVRLHARRYASQLVNVHLEDIRAGVHEHLMFGEGEIDFPPVLAALHAANYRGGIHVELSRHSHDGPAAARRACEFLTPLLAMATGHPQG
ncbi:MAG: sugar phosphate isomerase/epimerase family protein [Pirellulales bacterium]